MQPATSQLLLVCFLAFVGFASFSNALKSKYSEKANANHIDGYGLEAESKFKTKKAKMIWEKAYRKHPGDTVTLDTLYEELKAVDKELLELKLVKSENGDPYGNMEIQLDEKIHEILNKYKIAGKKQSSGNKLSNRVADHLKNDDKYERMYNKAQKLGFSENELKDLKDEIFHHQLKMAELDTLIGDLKTAEDDMRIASNIVDQKLTKEDSPGDPQKIKELKDAIKEKKQEMMTSKNRISMLSDGDNPSLAKDKTFTQQKIIRLWADVLKSDFTPEERESLKEELMHLENKMNKMDRLNEQKSLLEKHKNMKPESENMKEKYEQKHLQAKEKSDQLDKHVNKYMRDINSRISERGPHSEL